MNLLVSDLMTTDFLCCTQNQTVREVLPMFTQTHSNMLPVVDEFQKLIGIITKNKIFQLLITSPSMDLTINEIYQKSPIYLYPTDDLEDTRTLLLKHNVGHAPIVDHNMVPVGVISTKQLLWSYNVVYSQLTSMLEVAYDAIILIDHKAEISMVNKGFTDLFGLTNKDVLNKSTKDIFPEFAIENVIKSGLSVHNSPQLINGQANPYYHFAD